MPEIADSPAPARKPMTPAERARHASLVRWGKEQPLGKPDPAKIRARVAALLAGKKKPKKAKAKAKAKPKKTDAQRAAEREARHQKNIDAVAKQMAESDTGLSPGGARALAAFGKGQQPNAAVGDGLVKMGLAEKAADGSYRMTSSARAALNAMRAGDYQRAVDAISRGKDAEGKREGREKAKAERTAASDAKKQEAEKGKAERATQREQQVKERATAVQARQQEREKATQARKKEQGKTKEEAPERAPQTEKPPVRTPAAPARTPSRGNGPITGAPATGSGGGGGGKDPSKNERRRELAQDINLSRLEAGGKLSASAQAELEEAGLVDADGKLTEEGKKRLAARKPLATKDINMDYEAILDAVEHALASLASDPEVKAGARHSASDTAIIQAIYDSACDLCEMAVTLGASEGEAEEDEPMAAKAEDTPAVSLPNTKGIESFNDGGEEVVTLPGYSAKALADGWTGGYLVRFGGDGDLSQWRDVFDKDTDYGRATKSDVWVHHRMLPGVGKRRLTNQAEIGMDDEGVFIKHLLDLRSVYERRLYDLVQADKLGWSSGTAPHLVERKALGDGRHKIDQWPLGLDASYTPMPAGGMGVEARAGAMKSLLEDIDLITIVHEASIADDSVKSIDTDSQEVSQGEGERSDGTKAQTERARALSLELDILALETAQ